MRWRFADLPVRTKFLITVGIPVLGMVLLIGKQVDSSIKRRNVMGYIRLQSERLASLSHVLHDLQHENEGSVGFLTGQPVTAVKLEALQLNTDLAVKALQDPGLLQEPAVLEQQPFSGLELLRERVLQRDIPSAETARSYRRMNGLLLDEISRVGRLALDPETKDRLYAHLRLLYAKEALSEIRIMLLRNAQGEGLRDDELSHLASQVSQYETNMLLFERDAPPLVLGRYRRSWQGPEVNFMRSVIGTVREKRSLEMAAMPADRWWELTANTLEKLKEVEDLSMQLIDDANKEAVRKAELRLLLVILALFGVIGAVAVMTFVIMRGLRRTVEEVSRASEALASGDISVRVEAVGDDEVGRMARSFNRMIDNVRSLAASADAIGKGNFNTPVDVRGDGDVLGIALKRMKENLLAARLRAEEQNQALQQEKEKLEEANERIQVLIKEMHHRVKNNLQVVASLLRLQGATIEDPRLQHAFEQSQSRVTSMALIHERLYKGDKLASVDLALYLEELFAELITLNEVKERITYEADIAPGLTFDLHTMVPLGLILNELITNSFKHAFRGRDTGNIKLAIRQDAPEQWLLEYRDDGVGMPPRQVGEEEATLGFTLIDSLVEQLSGTMEVESSSEGTRYSIRFKAR